MPAVSFPLRAKRGNRANTFTRKYLFAGHMMEPFASEIDDQTIVPVPGRLDVVSVGVMLCPNRNLTTLTAAVLLLNPHAHVLNMASSDWRPPGCSLFAIRQRRHLEAFLRGARLFGIWPGRPYGGNILLIMPTSGRPCAPRCATLCGRAGQAGHPLPGLQLPSPLLEYARASDISVVGSPQASAPAVSFAAAPAGRATAQPAEIL